MSDFECKKCGRCCQVGTIWVHSEHPIIKALAEAFYGSCPDLLSDTGRCQMLTADNRCLIEVLYGKKYKPEPCNGYPFDGEKCHREKDE